MVDDLKQRARRLKAELHALVLAYRDPRVPWYARAFAAGVVAYAISPIDLIPDFIPIIGYLDDLILVPLGIVLSLRMIPPEVLAECRERAKELSREGRPTNWVVAGVIIGIWVALTVLAVVIAIRLLTVINLPSIRALYFHTVNCPGALSIGYRHCYSELFNARASAWRASSILPTARNA